jgi:hypothetical protein
MSDGERAESVSSGTGSTHSDSGTPLYELRPLLFQPDDDWNGSVPFLVAETILGRLYVGKLGKMKWFLDRGNVGGECATIEDGIRLATAWYHEAIAPALERIAYKP